MKKILTALILSALLLTAAACSTGAPPAEPVSTAASSEPDLESSSSIIEAAERLVPDDAIDYKGAVVSVETQDGGKTGSLTMQDDSGEEYIFHFNESTIIGIDLSAVQPGDLLNIRHSPAATFSIPPQSAAYEILSAGQAQDIPLASEPIHVADAAVYRGVVDDFAVDDNGHTALILRQVPGTDFGYPVLQAVLDENTRYSFDTTGMGNGSYLEIFYGGQPDASGTVTAIAVNDMGPVDLVVYNGILVEANTEENYLLLDPVDENGMQYRFNFNDSTQFYLDSNALAPGDKLNVLHDAASTRSIPPQSFAREVRPMAALENAPAPIPAANPTSSALS